jgi:hypothetical protein
MELGANLDSKRLNCGKQFDNQIDQFKKFKYYNPQ